MVGNISKSKGFKGDKGDSLKFTDLSNDEKEALRGRPTAVTFELDNEGTLWCISDGVLVDMDYVASQNLATKTELAEINEKLIQIANQVAPSPASVTLYANRWIEGEEEKMWYQAVVVANATITPYSKVDLQLSAEQVAIFYEKDLAFVTENDGGFITVYCIGRKPENDYVIQATVSEVVIDAE